MNLLQQIKGVSQEELGVHSNPIINNETERTEEKEKRQASLLKKCMRSLIEERMSGCLINIARGRKLQSQEGAYIDNQNSQSHMRIHQFPDRLTQKDKDKNLDNENLRIKNFSKKYLIFNQNKRKSLNSSGLVSLGVKAKIQKYEARRYSVIGEGGSTNRSINESAIRKSNGTNFISAIDLTDRDQKIMRVSNSQKSQKNGSPGGIFETPQKILPRIMKNKNPIELGKNIKQSSSSLLSLNKQTSRKNSQIGINIDLWIYLSHQKNPKFYQRKTSSGASDIASMRTVVSNSPQKNPHFTGITSKDNLMTYFNSLPFSLKRLMTQIISFFDIKFPQQLTVQNYFNLIDQKINNIDNRIWSVISFIFWDKGRDGIINSRDTFEIFRQANGFGQKDEESQNKKQEKSREIVKGLQNVQKSVELFKKTLSNLNAHLSKITPISQLHPRPQSQIYLQQSMITQQNLKMTEIIQLISTNDEKTNQIKLSLLGKDTDVKCTSSYRQCFISTQHNQETRMMRDRIQRYRLDLRKKKDIKVKEKQQKIENNLTVDSQISYQYFVQNNLGASIKQICKYLLGYEC